MIEVVAGIIERDQQLLLTERRRGTHLAGAWEFPGGKIQPQESPFTALQRELNEEIGIIVNKARPLIRVHWDYPQCSVAIDFWRVTDYSGYPSGNEGQRLQWLPLTAIDRTQIPASNGVVLSALALPDHYAITPEPGASHEVFIAQAQALLRSRRIRMLQLRSKTATAASLTYLATRLQPLCVQYDTVLLLNSAVEIARSLCGVGVHLNSEQLYAYNHRPLDPGRRVGVSCHTGADLAQAAAIKADFATLGPIHPTVSHPNAAAIGWSRFRSLTAAAQLPVYALGGLQPEDRDRAWLNGAQGVAAIRGFWTGVLEGEASIYCG